MEQPAARLEVLSGKGAGMSLVVVDQLLIGRSAEGSGRLADDEEISRTHARLSIDSAGRCVIEDLRSTNGTFVNRRRISEPQQLEVGDTLELGATILVVRDVPTPVVTATVEPVPSDTAASPSPIAGAGAPASTPPAAPEPTVIEATVIGASTMSAPPEAQQEPPTQTHAPEPEASEAPATLSLGLEIDFGAGEVRLTPAGAAAPIRLVFRDGSWRADVEPGGEREQD